jgi:hypothetical protein
MTPEQFKRQMEKLNTGGDIEAEHSLADRLMCEVLRELGYGDGVELFEKMEKWYA